MAIGVSVAFSGSSKFGERWDCSISDLAKEAWKELGAVQKPDLLFVAGMSSGGFSGQEHLGAFIAQEVGISGVPAMRIEAACASGGAAVRAAWLAIKSGKVKTAAVIGVEKMTDVSSCEVGKILSMAAHSEEESLKGATFPGLYSLVAKRHMHEFGTTEMDLAVVSEKNHRNGKVNPHAHFFGKDVSAGDVLKSPYVANPLKILDCSPVSDGASAVFLAEDGLARRISETPAKILSIGQGGDLLSLGKRASIVSFSATKKAARDAYLEAGLCPGKIDLAEVHDCFTIAELVALEDLGFFPKGKSAKATNEGKTAISGELPINPSGGLKAKGHPVGATGVSQVAECFRQLSGEKRHNIVRGAKFALAHNVGGVGATATVAILGRGDS